MKTDEMKTAAEREHLKDHPSREEARSILERYYRHLHEHGMDRLFWDCINQAVIVFGGEGDGSVDHEEHLRMYARDGVTFRQVMEEEISWTRRVPEIDPRLPDALQMAFGEMERRCLV